MYSLELREASTFNANEVMLVTACAELSKEAPLVIQPVNIPSSRINPMLLLSEPSPIMFGEGLMFEVFHWLCKSMSSLRRLFELGLSSVSRPCCELLRVLIQ